MMRTHGEYQVCVRDNLRREWTRAMIAEIQRLFERLEQRPIGGGRIGPRARARATHVDVD